MGARSSVPSFDETLIPDQTGKIVIVTGSNVGIGYSIAEAFVKKNASTVILASRSLGKLSEASENLRKSNPESKSKILTEVVDLSSFKSIESFVSNITKTYSHIDILINNAAVFIPPFSKTEQGFEVTLGTNVLGTVFLTNSLLPLLKKSQEARIITLSSGAVNFTSDEAFNKFISDIGGSKETESTLETYAMSKLFITFYTKELQKQINNKGISNIITICVDPGFVASDIQNKTEKSFLSYVLYVFSKIAAKSTQAGALSALYAATSPDAVNFKGEMLSEGPYVQQFNIKTKAYNEENSERTFKAIDDYLSAHGFQKFSI